MVYYFFLIKHIFLQKVSYGHSETYFHFNFGKLFERDSVLLKESGFSIKKKPNKNIDVNMQSWNEEGYSLSDTKNDLSLGIRLV